MVNLTRIYTRTGDDGTTSLGDMSRTGKNDPRLKAYADVDEANCAIGLALAASEFPDDVNDLFDVGADLCTPVVEEPAHPPLRVTEPYVDRLEKACDEYNERLEPLRSFVLPGGTVAASQLHVARTVVRRAERYKAHDERETSKAGDKVRIVETRPMSKDKRWRVAEIIEKGPEV